MTAGAPAHAQVLEASAHAKVNLVLAVGARGDDGYHELVSVVQRFDVADELRIVVEPAAVVDVAVDAPALAGGDTLVTRALTLLLERVGHGARVRVDIDKQLPVGAGLGGGSSDAGTAMLAVNAALGMPLSAEELVALAAEVGSDVPFFASGVPAAVIEGRGERVTPIPGRLPVPPVVLVWPGVEQSTAEVYAAHTPSGRPLPSVAEAGASVVGGTWFNDLAAAAAAVNPRVAEALAIVESCGAGAIVAGSGATVVAVPAAYDAAAVTALAERLRLACAHLDGAWVREARPLAAEVVG